MLFIPTLLVVLVGCGMGPEPTAMPTSAPTYAAVPTYTPTPVEAAGAAAATEAPTAAPIALVPMTATVTSENTIGEMDATAVITATAATTTAVQLAPTAVATLPAVTSAEPATPQLVVAGAAVNLRSGPGTSFAVVGGAEARAAFDLLARSADGGWWQICCVDGQRAWIYGELATVTNAEAVAVAEPIPTPVQPTPLPVAPTSTPPPVEEAVAEAPSLPVVDPHASSAGDFNPDAQYQIVHFRLLGLGENNGGIRDSGAQHHIFLTVLDANGNGVDGAVVENLVGEKGTVTTGGKGPGKAEITMYWEPFKLRVASDPSGPVTSQTSNQMGLAFPHLPDLVGKLGDESYEYGACPTLEIKCAWPIQAIHFSYEITFQKVR